MPQVWIMSVNKDLYKYLFKTTCRGMGHVRRGSLSRYELLVREPSESMWRDIQEQTYATGKDLETFMQGARGHYYEIPPMKVEYSLPFGEVLPGEVLWTVYQLPDTGGHGELKILKLDDVQYIVIDSKDCPLPLGSLCAIEPDIEIARLHEVKLPKVGQVQVSHVGFYMPSDFHRGLDVALLHGYRQAKVAASIIPLYDWLRKVLLDDISMDVLEELLMKVAETGMSTYTIRRLIDCYFAQQTH